MNSPIDQFQIVNFQLILKTLGFEIAITNLTLLIGFVATFLLLSMTLASIKTKIVYASNFYIIKESVYSFMINLVNEQVSGSLKVKKYLPYIFYLFTFILISNMVGILPYINTSTSYIAVTFGLAGSSFLGVTIIGLVKHKITFFSLFMPNGTPIKISPLIIPIEAVSYCFRWISLSVRLFANIFAGKILSKIAVWICVIQWNAWWFYSLELNLTILAICVYLCFEVGIGMLQAYVFTILSCIFLTDALYLH